MEIKIKADDVWLPCYMAVEVIKGEERVFIKGPYNLHLIAFQKSMEMARWDPSRKAWHGLVGPRTSFRLDFGVQGQINPYLRWRIPQEEWPDIDMDRPYMDHQVKAIRQTLASKRMVWAQEMRTGKTLQVIKILEEIGGEKIWWVSNKSGIAGVMVDLEKWGANLPITMMTYEECVKRVKNWEPSQKTPTDLILDECHLVKTPGTQRSHHVVELVRGMMEDNDDPVIIAMSGTVAPKNPVDWWNPCEIVAPGYLQEASTPHFQNRLGLVVEGESKTGGWFPDLLTWFDDPLKCRVCGQFEDENPEHNDVVHIPKDKEAHKKPHKWLPSKDELTALGKRLNGLVHVQHKKDCLDLPDLVDNFWYYNDGWNVTTDLSVVRLKASDEVKKQERLVKQLAPNAGSREIRLREVSDGFQYEYVDSGKTETCPECKGEGSCLQWNEFEEQDYEECWKCDGQGECAIEIRTGARFHTPKDDLLRLHLEEFETTGRQVVFAGFQESVDRIVDVCLDEGWNAIRVDGRGWQYFGEYKFKSHVEALKAFADTKNFDRLVFVGHPKSGGAGISLSASACIIFYSNVDTAEDKIQARARIHDLGMDTARGAVIQEYFHLEADMKCINRYIRKMGWMGQVAGDSQTMENNNAEG